MRPGTDVGYMLYRMNGHPFPKKHHNLAESLPRRVDTFITAKGGPTPD